jgi:hypothetical protein
MTRAWLIAALTLMLLPMAPLHAQDDEEGIDAIEGCAWKDQTLTLHDRANQQLSFRYQDCDGTNAAKVIYALNDKDELIQTMAVGQHAYPVAHFWALSSEKPSGLIPKVASPSLPDKEKDRCQVVLDYESRTYAFEPNAAYMEELLAVDEPFAACGEFGTTNDAIQFFTTIDNALLVYFWLGQDTPLFDPESFKYVNTEKPGVVE